jgi:hypothetical protein
MSMPTENPAPEVSDSLPKCGRGQSPASRRNLWRGREAPAHHPAAALGTDWQPMPEAMTHVSTTPASEDRTHQERNLRAWLKVDPQGFMSAFVGLQKTLAKDDFSKGIGKNQNLGKNKDLLLAMREVLAHPASADTTHQLKQLRRWLRQDKCAFLRRLVTLEGPALLSEAYVKDALLKMQMRDREEQFDKELEEMDAEELDDDDDFDDFDDEEDEELP